MGRRAGGRLGTLIFLALPTAPVAASPSRPPAPIPAAASCAAHEDDDATRVEKLIQTARTGRAVIRPQAAERLLGMGEPAARRLAELAAEDPAALGPELVAVLPRMGDRELRALSWTLLEDRDFPWRPAAIEGLARSAGREDGPALERWLDDPLAAVRVAALRGLESIEGETHLPGIRARLADEDGAVRRRAARLLVQRGEACAAFWLLAELERDDRFFSLPTGRLARYEAWRFLTELGLTSGLEFDGEAAPAGTAETRQLLGLRLGVDCPEVPELPRTALPGQAREGDRIGLELRSCRRGELFLAWNEADLLLVGRGRPARVRLPEGTVAALVRALEAAADSLEESSWGQPGCDLERLQLASPGGGRTFLLSKGPETGQDLRPEELDRVVALLAGSLPDAPAEDPRLDGLRSRVLDALAVLGGQVAPEAPVQLQGR